MLDPYDQAGADFDPNLWDKKSIVLRIDSSAKAERLGVTGANKNKILGGDNEDLFSVQASPWVGSGLQPSELLVQPLQSRN